MRILIYVLGVIATVSCKKMVDDTMPDMVSLCYRLTKFDGEKIMDLSWDNPQFTCFHACMMEQRGEMEAGKIKVDKYIENHIKEYNPYMDQKAKLQIVECSLEANDEEDKCSAAGLMGKCITDNWHLIVNEKK